MSTDIAKESVNMLQNVGNKNTLREILGNAQGAIRAVLPRHITPDRVLKMAMVAALREPKIYNCTGASVINAIMRASELGLDFSGTLGEGWIIPFKREATFIPGYRGYLKLARNTGQISRIEAHVVYEDDRFDLEFGLEPKLVHVPNLKRAAKRVVLCAYMVAQFKDGAKQLEVMTLQELEDIRNRSRAKDNGPWVTDRAEMYRKTVVRRGSKYLPLSPEMEKLITYDNVVDGIVPAEILGPPAPAAGVDALTARIVERGTASEEGGEKGPATSKCPHCEGPLVGGETEKCPHCDRTLREPPEEKDEGSPAPPVSNSDQGNLFAQKSDGEIRQDLWMMLIELSKSEQNPQGNPEVADRLLVHYGKVDDLKALAGDDLVGVAAAVKQAVEARKIGA